MEPFVLASEHVRLSTPTVDDVEHIDAMCQDEQIQRWTTVPSPYRREHAEDFVTRFVPRGWESGRELTWAIRRAGDVLPGEAEPTLLGMVGLHLDATPAPNGSGEVGFWMAPGARGRGLMTEAARLVVDYGLDPEGLGLARVEWRAVVGNWGSRRIAWKVGIRVEGEIRGLLVHRGVRLDGWVGTILPGDPREPNEPWPAHAPTR
ncbi:acetyltransferase, GNAT family [Xylanimonas cellulosilytica DSM 15894]|uniref:Acetyltransferase, GNAT family n=1 Tax=Xylanimonas cellulosilytica (strain DSM 15894 / JCM 12276 / CECT 5975 / KCTC 9989 / LMG 20990 / NBRC 107835 / XIL07) TaxID=446471 RepID=D1BS09_XYLCX|nr:GNAT family protein [Xylanimonas cellulosilytica]ACZ30501.1 acetyltransferase, GNAT family [Xylanimonas cellulosilytica DSM 15894]